MTIEEMKQKFIDGSLELGLFTANDKIVIVTNKGFVISTTQKNGWTRLNIYEYIDNEWVESETYEKAKEEI